MPNPDHVSKEMWDAIVRYLKSDLRTAYADAGEVEDMNATLRDVVLKVDGVLKLRATEEDKKLARNKTEEERKMERYKMVLGVAGKLVGSAILLWLGSLL